MEEKKQTPEEMKEALEKFANAFSTDKAKRTELTDAILNHATSIFSDDSKSLRERLENIGRIKSAYVFAKKNTGKDEYTNPIPHGELVGRLSKKNLKHIISYLDALIEELERLVSSGKETQVLTFKDCLSNVRREELITEISNQVKKGKGKIFAYLVHALEETKTIIPSVDQKNLFRAMANQFGDIGTYSGFHSQYCRIRDRKDKIDKAKIEHYKSIISPFKT